MQDCADPDARERVRSIARQDPPPGVSPEAAEAEVWEVLSSMGTAPDGTSGHLKAI